MASKKDLEAALMVLRRNESFKHNLDCAYLRDLQSVCHCCDEQGNYMFCVECGHPYTFESSRGLNCCAECGSRAIPMQAIDAVNLKINWHELRTLVMWAENFAASEDFKATQEGFEPPEGYTMEDRMDLVPILKGIARRLQAQYPRRQTLTIAGELAQLKNMLPDIEFVGDIAPDPTMVKSLLN